MQEELRDPLIGRTVGNYRIEQKLGQGGFGAVYRLVHARLPDTFAALKVLTLDGAASEAERARFIKRFEQEAMAAAAAAAASHRIVKPIDIGQLDDGTPYFLMEYVPGRSLAEELEERVAFDVVTALVLAGRIADAMVVVHERGIVHRDLKPSNVMVIRERDDLTVKILDFGVARASGELKVAHTGERVVIGTAGYMAPEAAAALAVDGRADVFSLGALLYRMLSGVAPFAAATQEAVLLSTFMTAPPPIAEHRPRHLDVVPSSVEALVTRALVKETSERPAMAEYHRLLVATLKTILAGTPGDKEHSFLRALTPNPEDAPTLSTPAGEVAALLERLALPDAGTPRSSAETTVDDQPAPAGVRSFPAASPAEHSDVPRARRWMVVAAALLAAGAAGLWLLRQPAMSTAALTSQPAAALDAGSGMNAMSAPPTAPAASPADDWILEAK